LELKRCIKCGIEYPVTIDYFSKYTKSKDGFYSICKTCNNLEHKHYREKNGRKWYENILTSIRCRSKTSNKDNDIDKEFLLELKEKQNDLCYWLKIPIDFSLNDKLRRPSIDRIDNSGGYTKDNVVLTTQFANLGRQSELPENFQLFIENFLKNNKIKE
jgi:hypothetical protein